VCVCVRACVCALQGRCAEQNPSWRQGLKPFTWQRVKVTKTTAMCERIVHWVAAGSTLHDHRLFSRCDAVPCGHFLRGNRRGSCAEAMWQRRTHTTMCCQPRTCRDAPTSLNALARNVSFYVDKPCTRTRTRYHKRTRTRHTRSYVDIVAAGKKMRRSWPSASPAGPKQSPTNLLRRF